MVAEILVLFELHNDEVILPEPPCSYYNAHELNDRLTDVNGLLVFHHNVRSFNRNFDALSLLLGEISYSIDVIILSETWFVDMLCSEVDGYCGYHVCRTEKGGGGVSIYVRLGLQCRPLLDYNTVTDSHEICCVEVLPDPTNPTNNCTILGIYRPPNARVAPFLTHLEALTSSIPNKSIILCGDFNIDLLNEGNNDEISNVLYSFNFFPLINIATRITVNSASCLDHIWYNKLNISFSGAVVANVSDHYPVFCVIDIPKKNQTISKTFRSHCKSNIDKFCIVVRDMCKDYFDLGTNSKTVDEKCCYFTSHMEQLYNRCFPIRVRILSIKYLLKPWITQDIRRRAKFKHYLFKQYKLNNVTFEAYNQYKNNLSNIVRLAKISYYKVKFQNCNRDIKKTWKTINKILSKSSHSKSNAITLLNDNGDEVNDPHVVSNIFCNYFSTIADRLDDNIPLTDTDPMYYMPDPIPDTFNPAPANANEVEGIISALEDKPSNINNIPIFIIKKVSHLISPIICDIFNSSLTHGHFPTDLKHARVIPLYKAKSNKEKNNFRPISILPLLSKLIEKLMKNRAVQFINDSNILYNYQFGFREGRNTSDAVLHYVDECVTALDNKSFTISVFLDFSKAFDTVNRDILLRKMDRLGFRGNVNNFFKTYLTDRSMYVSVNGCDSTTGTVNIGVPQGSVSASWLFTLYINDMHRCSRRLKFIHFADDTTIYMTGSNLKELTKQMCEELNAIDDWLKTNRLSLNISKTSYMIHTHNHFDLNDCVLTIRGTPIKYVRFTKFLGLIIDDRLSFNDHMYGLSKQLSRVKGVLFKLSSFLPPFMIRQLYFALFYSRLAYCISVWGGGNITNINKVSRINRSVINLFVSQLPPNIAPPFQYSAIYQYHSLLTFHRYVYNFNNNFPYFYNKIALLLPNHEHVTRFALSNNFFSPIVTKTVTQHQFIFNVVKLWNLLPQALRCVQPQISFKSKLRAYIKSQLS